ncbi:multidrug effflux MFS transporter [Arthrobacter methylotrophus]|uniref:Multidrug effflux MFS transporter n=1 Tax=Arthrobacter methylotrophus TaxID=121291 RepID=A0ABV5UM43_9MICC
MATDPTSQEDLEEIRNNPSGPSLPIPPSSSLVVVLAAVSAVPQLAIDMYLPGFPDLSRDLQADPFAVQLTLTAFMAGLAAGQLVIGPVSDQFGRRRLLLWGSALCAVATVLCAIAPTIEALILFRLLQGLTGAAGVVLARAVIADRASGSRAASLFSLMIAIQGAAPVVAPLAGGVVVQFLGWRGVFWALAVISVALWLLATFFIAESLPVGRRRAGGLSELRRMTAAVLRNRSYLHYCLAVGFGLGSMFCYIAASPFILQETYGMDAGWFSVVFAANAAGIALFSALSAGLVRRFSPVAVMRLGLSLMAAGTTGYFILTLTESANLWSTLVLFFVIVGSLGLVLGNATALAVAQAREAAGTAVAVIGAAEFLIGAAAAPLVGLGGENLQPALGAGMLTMTLIAAIAGWTSGRRCAPQQEMH